MASIFKKGSDRPACSDPASTLCLKKGATFTFAITLASVDRL